MSILNTEPELAEEARRVGMIYDTMARRGITTADGPLLPDGTSMETEDRFRIFDRACFYGIANYTFTPISTTMELFRERRHLVESYFTAAQALSLSGGKVDWRDYLPWMVFRGLFNGHTPEWIGELVRDRGYAFRTFEAERLSRELRKRKEQDAGRSGHP